MQGQTNKQNVPSTAKAVGLAALIVGGYWAIFGGVMAVVIHPHDQTPIAQQLPPAGDPHGKAIDASRPLDHVRYRNVTLEPIGKPVSLDETKIGFLAQTDEGYGIWTLKPATGDKARLGGGGGRSAPRGLPAAVGPVYLRTTDGHWWQVVQRNS